MWHDAANSSTDGHNELKSLILGEAPKLAPVILAPLETPMEAPLSKLMVVLFDNDGFVMTRVDVSD